MKAAAEFQLKYFQFFTTLPPAAAVHLCHPIFYHYCDFAIN